MRRDWSREIFSLPFFPLASTASKKQCRDGIAQLKKFLQRERGASAALLFLSFSLFLCVSLSRRLHVAWTAAASAAASATSQAAPGPGLVSRGGAVAGTKWKKRRRRKARATANDNACFFLGSKALFLEAARHGPFFLAVAWRENIHLPTETQQNRGFSRPAGVGANESSRKKKKKQKAAAFFFFTSCFFPRPLASPPCLRACCCFLAPSTL